MKLRMCADGSIDLDWLSSVIYSAVVSDSCDHNGLRNQTVTPGLSAMSISSPTLVGWARTVRAVPVSEAPGRPYGGEIDFIDSLRPGDVVLADTSGSEYGFWGELFSTAATGRGARGAVIDGLVRDRLKMADLGFPVYAKSSRPADSLGRLSVAGQDGYIWFRGVGARPGDLVVADVDGVVIVPRENATPVLEYAVEKASIESDARRSLLAGAKLADAWEKYHVL